MVPPEFLDEKYLRYAAECSRMAALAHRQQIPAKGGAAAAISRALMQQFDEMLSAVKQREPVRRLAQT